MRTDAGSRLITAAPILSMEVSAMPSMPVGFSNKLVRCFGCIRQIECAIESIRKGGFGLWRKFARYQNFSRCFAILHARIIPFNRKAF